MKLTVEKTFEREARRLPPDREKAVWDALETFLNNPDYPSLRFRNLKGRPGYFIINGRRGDRVILRADDGDSFAAVDTGPHDNVYRRWDRLKR